jgi:DNA modification methylase
VREKSEYADHNQRNVWILSREGSVGAHSAVFPGEIPRRAILAGTKEGDTVLDPFIGSGTTVAVAKSLARSGIGIDINLQYLSMAAARIMAVPLAMALWSQ